MPNAQNNPLYGQKAKPTTKKDSPLVVQGSNTHVLAGEKTSVWAHCQVTAPKATSKERLPADVVLVLDTSGSMGQGPGSPLDHAIQASRYVVERLQGDDRCAIVCYGSHVEIVHDLSHDHQAAKTKLSSLPSLGMTALADGLYAGIEQCDASDKKRTRRVFLLSDGHANVGDVDPEVIGRKVEGAARAGVQVSTFGLGGGYNEELMERIAKAGDGGYYFLETPDEAPQAFAAELEGLFSSTIKDATLTIDAKGAKLVRLLGLDAEKSPIKVGDVPAEATRSLLVELEAKISKKTSVLKATLAYLDEAGDSHQEEVELQLQATSDENLVKKGLNAKVLAKVAELEASEAQAKAAALADKGDYASASSLLAGSRTLVGNYLSTYGDDEALSEKLSELTANEAVLSAGTYSTTEAKRMKFQSYGSRNSRKR